MNNYSDYLEVVDFPSEINPSSIKDSSFDWKKTYAHKTFIELLKAAEAMLARQTSNSKKSLWVHGAYGTGKSRLVWTLKKLLECLDEDFNEYFSSDELKDEPDLRDKLAAHRHSGRIITAYRYSCGEINNFDDFIMAIYKDVSAALKKANLPYEGENTLRGGIVKWLEDEDNRAYFEAKIRKPEYRHLGSLSGKSAEDILSKLKNPNVKAQELIREILFVAKNEGITVLSKDVDDLMAWLTDVIEKNNLKAIVFFWDEFSEFFRKNRNYLDTFQKFNELSNNKPFNMVIVTHNAIFDEDDKDGKKVRDRFVEKSIELPDTIAFDLIAHVINVKESHKDLWRDVSRRLYDSVDEARKAVSRFVWKNEYSGEKKLNGILPLHPMAALLLKHISTAFASNQRSMFNFIKNKDSDDLHAFQWFINTHSPDGSVNDDDSLLTIDYLWNFFYEKGTDDFGSAMGRNSLDTQIRNILDSYAQNESRLHGNEDKRVLKTILMMQAMSEKLHNQVPLFLATEENIELAFNGLAWRPGKAKGIAQRLVQEKILFKKPIGNSKEVFAATVVSGDSAKIEEIIDDLRRKNDTAALIQDFIRDVPLTKSQEKRFHPFLVTLSAFTSDVNKIADDPTSVHIQSYQIPLVMMFARTSEERSKLQRSLKEKLADPRYNRIVFWDLTASLLPDDKYEELLKYKAEGQHYRQTDSAQSKNYERYANDILKEWKASILKAPQTVYCGELPGGRNCQTVAEVQQALNEIVLKRYAYSFDNVPFTEQMWALSSSQPVSIVSLGIEERYGSTIIKEKVIQFFEKNSQALQDLKNKMDAIIQSELIKNGRVTISSLFDKLMEFGFMPCNVYAYLTGWILRDYADKKYRRSDDENNSAQMNTDNLAKIVSEYIKHKVAAIPRYKEKYIEKLTPNQKAFVDLAHAIWNDVPEDASVEDVINIIRIKLPKLDYPLWALEEQDCQGAEEYLSLLARIANTYNSSENAPSLAEDLGKMYLENRKIAAKLKSLLTREKVKEAMEKFLSHFENGVLFQLANEIQASTTVMQDVKRMFSQDGLWLWNKETGVNEIQKLIIEYRIVAVSNQLLSNNASSLDKAFRNWNEQIRTIRIPYQVIIQYFPDVKELFKFFHEYQEFNSNSNDRMPNKRYEEFLRTLENSREAYNRFIDQKMDVFKTAYNFQLKNLSSEEIGRLYADLPNNLFSVFAPDAKEIVSNKAKAIEDSQLQSKLRKRWKELTGTDSPRAWSEKYRTPILIMVPENEQEIARRAFDAINQTTPEKSAVRNAMEYLENAPAYFQYLNNPEKINAAFLKEIVKNYSSLLDNPDEIRDQLCSQVQASYYDWYGNSSVSRFIEQLGQEQYIKHTRKQAIERVEQMNDEQIKKLLLWLVNNSADSGIKILNEYEGE